MRKLLVNWKSGASAVEHFGVWFAPNRTVHSLPRNRKTSRSLLGLYSSAAPQWEPASFAEFAPTVPNPASTVLINPTDLSVAALPSLLRRREKKMLPSLNRLSARLLLVGLAFAAAACLADPNHAVSAEPNRVSLFDGQSLKGWTGNPEFWRVEDGTITGETTAEHP